MVPFTRRLQSRHLYRLVFTSLGPRCRPFCYCWRFFLAERFLTPPPLTLSVPTASTVALELLSGLLNFLSFVILAVAWHRYVLLGPETGWPKLFRRFGLRHLRFVLYSLALSFVIPALVLLFHLPVAAVVSRLAAQARSGSDRFFQACFPAPWSCLSWRLVT